MSLLPKKLNQGDRIPALSLRDEVNRLFDDFFGGLMLQSSKGDWAPAIDVSETDAQVVVKAELPGMDPKDIDIALLGDSLTIKGEKREEKSERDENYYRMERRYGSFQRSINLPASVDSRKVTAAYKNGVLTITLDKREESKARSIKVKVE